LEEAMDLSQDRLILELEYNGKIPLGKPTSKREGNIMMGLNEMGSSGYRQGPLAGFYEHSNEIFGLHKDGEVTEKSSEF
jgi:hypothetical protein